MRAEDLAEVTELVSEEDLKNKTMPLRLVRNRIADRLTATSHLSSQGEVHVGQDPTNEANWNYKQQILNILDEVLTDSEIEYQCFTIRCGDSTRTINENLIVGFILIR